MRAKRAQNQINCLKLARNSFRRLFSRTTCEKRFALVHQMKPSWAMAGAVFAFSKNPGESDFAYFVESGRTPKKFSFAELAGNEIISSALCLLFTVEKGGG